MNSREVTIKVLEKVLEEGAYSNIALSNELNNSDLNDKDKALATELVYGTLRKLNTLDMIIKSFVKDIKEMNKRTLNILRVAIYQMQFLDKVPSYAACNEAVELAKTVSEKDSKLVNGILRNYSQKEGVIELEFVNKIGEMAYEFSFAPWMIRMFIKQYGEPETLRILHGLNKKPKVTVRVNNFKGDYEDIFEELQGLDYDVEEGFICPEAICINNGRAIDKNPVFQEGKITVQDESAMLVAPLLELSDNLTVLDLCSAPGGKTTHIAELMNNTGKVLAFDLHENKLELINENAKRLGITNIETQEMDATKINSDLINLGDRVLIDVPCSGIGIVRKKPEIKWNKTRKDLRDIIEVQRNIMENAWQYLKPNGVMVYSTCTLNKEENEDNIEWFLREHNDAKIEKVYLGKSDNLRYNKDGSVTILPNEYMDGFFIARLRKA